MPDDFLVGGSKIVDLQRAYVCGQVIVGLLHDPRAIWPVDIGRVRPAIGYIKGRINDWDLVVSKRGTRGEILILLDKVMRFELILYVERSFFV